MLVFVALMKVGPFIQEYIFRFSSEQQCACRVEVHAFHHYLCIQEIIIQNIIGMICICVHECPLGPINL